MISEHSSCINNFINMGKLSFHTNGVSILVGEMGGTIRGGISRIHDPDR